MPSLSQLIIRTALVWLAVGFAAGGLALANKGVPLLPWLWALRLPHIHMLLMGWMVQFAWGVAYWILPRLDAQGTRGSAWLVWLGYAALNSGVVLAALADPLRAAGLTGAALGALPVLAGLLYVVAAAAFARHAWPRIVPFRTLPRPSAQAPPAPRP